MKITMFRSFPVLLMLLLAASPPYRSQESDGKGLPPLDVVGSYFRGSEFSNETITLDQAGGYVQEGFIQHDDQHSTQSGTYYVERNILLVKTNDGETPFVIVPWGKRLYLIPRDKMQHFCNFINEGFEPRGNKRGEFFLRNGDEKMPVVKLPEVPREWASFLLKKPVIGKVVSISHKPYSAGKDYDETVTVNVGKRQGLKPGMCLFIPSRPESGDKHVSSYSVVEIQQVEANRATAALDGEGMDPFTVGATVCTHMPAASAKQYQKIEK